MAKVLRIQDEEQFDESRSSRPGCMSGIFHAIEYHYWHSGVKKILPHRQHEDLIKHTKRHRRYQRISDDQDTFEVLRLLDAKTSHIKMHPRNRKTSSFQKRSLKARIKALVSEDKDKEQDQDFVPSPKLRRTYSIHHLESNEWVNPISFFPENVTESPVSSKTHSNGTHPENDDSQDILDMLEVDKELFVNTFQDCSQASVIKPKLIKSGSFPTAYKSGNRSFMPLKLKDKLNETYTISKAGKIKNSNEDLNSNTISRLRRISSLNESTDRYAQLFDFSVNKEATLHSSRSLKLTDGSESILSARQTRQTISLKRNSPNQESQDAFYLGSSSQNERNQDFLSIRKDTYAELNSTQDCDSLDEVIDKSDNESEIEDSPVSNSLSFGKDSHRLELKEDHNQISPEITQQYTFVPEYYPADEKVQILEGLNNSKKNMHLSTKDDDFTYVKKILERSGFLENGFQQTWYSSNQPLDPIVFQQIESHYFHDPESFAEEINELSHHLLIFDLVDEALVTMYKKSWTYYPKKLSSFCHISHIPTGSLILDDVWKHMSRLINLKHDMNESLNDIVSQDLNSDDGWMNLQSDSECAGHDLEDLILDQVLEELLFEF